MITLNDIFVKKFGKTILKNISFSIQKGQIVSLIGKNGAGKSTICNLLIGAIKPYSGVIIKEPSLKISYVPQIFERSILIPLKVKDFLLLGQKNKNNSSFKEHCSNLIKNLELTKILDNNLNSLSGGEMQKILLLRALLRNPNLLILDEAFSFLDFSSLLKLHKIVFNEQKKHEFAVLLISHDMDFVIKNTNYVICLKDKTVHCHGNYKDIKDTSYIRDLIGVYTHHHKEH